MKPTAKPARAPAAEFASFSPLAKLPGSRLERTWMYNRQRNEGGEMRTIALATLLAGGLLTTPALADQKFCGPEGTLEVHATSFTYKPHDSGDKTKVALATRVK